MSYFVIITSNFLLQLPNLLTNRYDKILQVYFSYFSFNSVSLTIFNRTFLSRPEIYLVETIVLKELSTNQTLCFKNGQR